MTTRKTKFKLGDCVVLDTRDYVDFKFPATGKIVKVITNCHEIYYQVEWNTQPTSYIGLQNEYDLLPAPVCGNCIDDPACVNFKD